MEDTQAWKELIAASLSNPTDHQHRNYSYESSLPSYLSLHSQDSIQDFEPHSGGIGYFDDPDESMFERYYWPSWKRGVCQIPTVRIQSIAQAIDLALGNYEHWNEIFTPNLPPWTSIDESMEVYLDSIVIDGDCTTFPLPAQVRHVVWDFSDFRDEENTNPSMSVVLLALFLAMPNLQSLCIKKIRIQADTTSLFAHFPSPLEEVHSCLDDLGVPPGFTLAPRLESLQFSNSVLSSSDVFFLGDCAIHQKVFPCLRNLKFYYCLGMSYSSILHISPVLNLSFDRWECSGWCWPQECSNPKNRSSYM